MRKTTSAVALLAFLSLAACTESQPRVIQASPNSPDITLTAGMATQVEMPNNGHVQTVIVGNPDLVTAQSDSDVVNLVGKGAGETNLIIRSRTSDGDVKVYQYKVTVQAH